MPSYIIMHQHYKILTKITQNDNKNKINIIKTHKIKAKIYHHIKNHKIIQINQNTNSIFKSIIPKIDLHSKKTKYTEKLPLVKYPHHLEDQVPMSNDTIFHNLNTK